MKTAYLVANGDLRLTANQICEEAQAELEKKIITAFEKQGVKIIRAHQYNPNKKHGFIDSQKYGIEVFRNIPKEAPLIVAEAVWEYTQHILPGLLNHKGPILTLANWSGQWPGLVGLLNINASLTKAGVEYSSIWSESFDDEFFIGGIKSWIKNGKIGHNISHVHSYKEIEIPEEDSRLGVEYAEELKNTQAIMGIFDEGCMGMYNAIVPEELLHPMGIFKERLSQATLYAKMQTVTDKEAQKIYDWLKDKGMKFKLGNNEATDLTEHQIIQQCKMYIAALRIADEFGCGVIGIQYQQGLKDLCPASDLTEGLLNNVDRPPVNNEETNEILYEGDALPHFNEADECAGIDSFITYKIWKSLGYSPETTLHDIRWGRHYMGNGLNEFVWLFQISGAIPAAHIEGGYAEAVSERQPPVYFKLGGGTLKGVSKPGYIVWSRVFIDKGKLSYDTGIGEVVKLPPQEIEERLKLTTYQWPIMNVILKGVTRDQMMARHKSNHIQVVYAPDLQSAKKGLHVKASAMNELGLQVSICGEV